MPLPVDPARGGTGRVVVLISGTGTLLQALIDAARAEGTLRPDVDFGDIGLLIGRLSQPLPVPFPRAVADGLAHRHLALLLDGLRGDRDRPADPLPGPALTLGELRALLPAPDPDDA